jgi:hypothetical protein
MNTKSKVLQLADLLETVGRLWEDEAAEELRRLHRENESLRQATEGALECLDYHWDNPDGDLEDTPYVLDAKKALRQALAEPANSTTDFVEPKTPAQPQQEPAQNMKTYEIVCPHCEKPHNWTYLKGKWIELTDDEGSQIWADAHDIAGYRLIRPKEIVQRISDKLKEKNHD